MFSLLPSFIYLFFLVFYFLNFKIFNSYMRSQTWTPPPRGIIIARTWKQPRCPSADEWIRKLWYIYTMEYYSAIKKNSLESVLMRWMKLEPIIQSEVSQKEKHQCSILTHIYGSYFWTILIDASQKLEGDGLNTLRTRLCQLSVFPLLHWLPNQLMVDMPPTEWPQLSAKDLGKNKKAKPDIDNKTAEKMALK